MLQVERLVVSSSYTCKLPIELIHMNFWKCRFQCVNIKQSLTYFAVCCFTCVNLFCRELILFFCELILLCCELILFYLSEFSHGLVVSWLCFTVSLFCFPRNWFCGNVKDKFKKIRLTLIETLWYSCFLTSRYILWRDWDSMFVSPKGRQRGGCKVTDTSAILSFAIYTKIFNCSATTNIHCSWTSPQRAPRKQRKVAVERWPLLRGTT